MKYWLYSDEHIADLLKKVEAHYEESWVEDE